MDFDEIVLKGMSRWPNVPAVFGWLSLDRRGRWRLRGEAIGNRAAREFIDRNYTRDERGRWFFQNGPQRVYVALELAPLFYTLEPDGALRAHTGRAGGRPRAVWMDETGTLWLEAAPGPGVLDGRDLGLVADRLCDDAGAALDERTIEEAMACGDAQAPGGMWLDWWGERLAVRRIAAADAPARLGFVREPVPEPA